MIDVLFDLFNELASRFNFRQKYYFSVLCGAGNFIVFAAQKQKTVRMGKDRNSARTLSQLFLFLGDVFLIAKIMSDTDFRLSSAKVHFFNTVEKKTCCPATLLLFWVLHTNKKVIFAR